MPFIPPAAKLLPPDALNRVTAALGSRMGWMKAHDCPCAYAGDSPGAALPRCPSCQGRGVFWDAPLGFTGLLTYMQTAAAPNEPGVRTDPVHGALLAGDPTVSIPSDAGAAYSESGLKDAFALFDSPQRRQSVLVSGDNDALPYGFNVAVSGVLVYVEGAGAVPAPPTAYAVSGSTVTLVGYPAGTAYAVEYSADPVFVAYRPVGGDAHQRPFGLGLPLPRRFHLATLDLWTRQRFAGDGPSGP